MIHYLSRARPIELLDGGKREEGGGKMEDSDLTVLGTIACIVLTSFFILLTTSNR
jgi:hypothetical protein